MEQQPKVLYEDISPLKHYLPFTCDPNSITSVITLKEAAMHFTLKLTQIGNSVGVILPKEALAALKLEKGDAMHLTSRRMVFV